MNTDDLNLASSSWTITSNPKAEEYKEQIKAEGVYISAYRGRASYIHVTAFFSCMVSRFGKINKQLGLQAEIAIKMHAKNPKLNPFTNTKLNPFTNTKIEYFKKRLKNTKQEEKNNKSKTDDLKKQLTQIEDNLTQIEDLLTDIKNGNRRYGDVRFWPVTKRACGCAKGTTKIRRQSNLLIYILKLQVSLLPTKVVPIPELIPIPGP